MLKDIQAKDIPDSVMLWIIEREGGWYVMRWTIEQYMPWIPEKVVLAKLRRLTRRKLIDGCPCGCRGDFCSTARGRSYLRSHDLQGV